MPVITDIEDYAGFSEKATRLNLGVLIEEIEEILEGFSLLVEERRKANGTVPIREQIDEGFRKKGGWTNALTGDFDWTKSISTGSAIGVEVQVSGRSDLLAVDVLHLVDAMRGGRIDLGLIIVPDDQLSKYLTDRTPNFATAKKHVLSRGQDYPIRIVGFRHDGTGSAIEKKRTNVGRAD